MSRSLSEFRSQQRFQTRLYQFIGFTVAVSLIYIIQLGNLQLVYGYENHILARKFVSRQEFTVAPRGLMFDRNIDTAPDPLVKNINYIDYVIYPSRFKNREAATVFLKEFSQIMGQPFDNYNDLLEPKNWNLLVRKNESVTLLHRITRREHERLAEFYMVTRFGEFITNHLRYYSMGPAMAHVTGYVGLPSRKELDRSSVLPYQTIGKGGLEARYDTELRGTDGIRIRHRVLDAEEQITRSEQGNNLVLTIDRKMQTTAYRALVASGFRGAIIAMKANTGEILTLVSQPTFDPNILSSGTLDQIRDHYKLVQENQGFLNIAIQAKFPPASTFKPLVALAGLESDQTGSITEQTTFYCGGHWELASTVPGVPPSRYWCWRPQGHGNLDMVGAIANSCSVYFYQLGYRIGPTVMIQFSRNLLMDQKSGIDLPGETSGFVPDQRWKQIQWSSQWYDGDTVNMAIGQGFLETTPIALASLYSAFANGGKIYRPHLVREIRDPDTGRVIRKFTPELVKEIPVKHSSLETVRRGLRAVVLRGTGALLNGLSVPAAGKTGTAQTKSKVQGRNHAWFAGYAPYEDPAGDPIVVVVFVEFGRGGAATAVPLAYEVFKTAFAGRRILSRGVGSLHPPEASMEVPVGTGVADPNASRQNNDRPEDVQ